MSKNNAVSGSSSESFSDTMMTLSAQSLQFAVLADEMGLDKVSLFSTVNVGMVGGTSVPSGTRVTVLGPAGFTGYVLVMTASKEVFEVWHENLRYCVSNGRNSNLN